MTEGLHINSKTKGEDAESVTLTDDVILRLLRGHKKFKEEEKEILKESEGVEPAIVIGLATLR